MTKEVYNPKEHAANDKKVGSKKAKAKEKTDEPVTEFETKLNKYGFIHISKKIQKSLPFSAEEPLKAKIEGDALIITKA